MLAFDWLSGNVSCSIIRNLATHCFYDIEASFIIRSTKDFDI